LLRKIIRDRRENAEYYKREALFAWKHLSWFAITFPEKYQNTFKCKIDNPLDIVFELPIKN
jgi:alkylation response protein AidB-like acyl-CoA dehydrogenase